MHSELATYTFWISSTIQLWLFEADPVSYAHRPRNYSYGTVNWPIQELYESNTPAGSPLGWTSQRKITTKLCRVMMSQITTIQMEIQLRFLHMTHHRQCVSLVSPASRPKSSIMSQCDPPHASLSEFTLTFGGRMIHHLLETVHMWGYWLMILQESHGFCSCEQKINTLIR